MTPRRLLLWMVVYAFAVAAIARLTTPWVLLSGWIVGGLCFASLSYRVWPYRGGVMWWGRR